MNELHIKIEKLEQDITKQLKKAKLNVFFTIIVYIILAGFIMMYTTFVMYTFKEVATPEVIAELLVGSVQDGVPALTEDINSHSDKYAEMLAKMTIEYARNTIPEVKILIKNYLNNVANVINNEMNTRCYPIISEYFKIHKADILEAFNTMTDQEAMAHVINQLINELDECIDILRLPTIESINNLKADISRLAITPNDKLTKRELAEKRLIAYWMFLLKHEYPTDKLKFVFFDANNPE